MSEVRKFKPDRTMEMENWAHILESPRAWSYLNLQKQYWHFRPLSHYGNKREKEFWAGRKKYWLTLNNWLIYRRTNDEWPDRRSSWEKCMRSRSVWYKQTTETCNKLLMGLLIISWEILLPHSLTTTWLMCCALKSLTFHVNFNKNVAVCTF